MRAGLNLDVDIVMRVGAIDETVEVRVDTPLLETRNAGQAVNISGELLRAVPLLERREWFGALTVVPGVTSAEWVNNERLFSVHGADASANVVQIDGADVTPWFGSSIRDVNLSTDAIDDIQIKTAGVDASSPLGIGGIINIATTSGTNTVRGLAMVLSSRRGPRSRRELRCGALVVVLRRRGAPALARPRPAASARQRARARAACQGVASADYTQHTAHTPHTG